MQRERERESRLELITTKRIYGNLNNRLGRSTKKQSSTKKSKRAKRLLACRIQKQCNQIYNSVTYWNGR